MNIHDKSRYHEVHARSLADPEGFWAEAAREIDWIEPAKKIFDPVVGRLWPLVFRRRRQHLLQRARPPCRRRPRRPGRADPRFAADQQRHEIHLCRDADEVKTLAAVMQDFGVAKGDRVILYMPMVPEAVIAMLACARIGAVHSVVFGGFAAKELATRIDDAKPKLIFSASCGIEPGRIVQYKPLLDEAISACERQAVEPASSCSGRSRLAISSPAATTTGRACARPRSRRRSPRLACRCSRPIRSTSSTPRARQACRRAWCATMAGIWSR